MTALTPTDIGTGAAPGARSVPESPTTGRLVKATLSSEWIKLRSVRSTVWSVIVTFVLTVGLGALFCSARVARADRLDPGELRNFDPTSFSLTGLFLAQLAIGVLGVLVMTSEYATGQIRATLAATPQRLLVLLTKLAVFVVSIFVIGCVTCFAAFFLGQSILSAKFSEASIGDPGALRAVIGGGLYLAVIGALGLGLGTILRRTAGAIAALVGLLLILPILVNFLPSPWNDNINKYLPMQAGSSIFRAAPPDSSSLSLWYGFAVFCGYAVVALIIGAVLLQRRDA